MCKRKGLQIVERQPVFRAFYENRVTVIPTVITVLWWSNFQGDSCLIHYSDMSKMLVGLLCVDHRIGNVHFHSGVSILRRSLCVNSNQWRSKRGFLKFLSPLVN